MPRPTADSPLGAVVRGLAAFNDRHPWSHNDFFHPWILRNLCLASGIVSHFGV